MHGFFFPGEEQVQIGSGGVYRAGGNEETNAQEPIDTLLERSGKIAHQPEGEATEIPSERAHEEHDDGGDERSSDDTAEKERSAVNLAFAPAEKIDDSDSSGGPEKGAERSQQCGEHWRKRDAGFDDKRKDGSEACAAGYAEDVGISERITK